MELIPSTECVAVHPRPSVCYIQSAALSHARKPRGLVKIHRRFGETCYLHRKSSKPSPGTLGFIYQTIWQHRCENLKYHRQMNVICSCTCSVCLHKTCSVSGNTSTCTKPEEPKQSIEAAFWSLSKLFAASVRSIALRLTAFSGSTCLCEEAFSHMTIIKSRYRSRLTDKHLKHCLHLCLSNYEHSFCKLSQDMRCHASTSQQEG